jgi:hypothetical protein
MTEIEKVLFGFGHMELFRESIVKVELWTSTSIDRLSLSCAKFDFRGPRPIAGTRAVSEYMQTFEGGERWLLLDEKPLERISSVYTNSETAIAVLDRPCTTSSHRVVDKNI